MNLFGHGGAWRHHVGRRVVDRIDRDGARTVTLLFGSAVIHGDLDVARDGGGGLLSELLNEMLCSAV